MYPNLFNIDGFSMTLMIFLGAITAFVIVFLYLKKFSKVNALDLALVILVTVFFGIVFAILFENTYEAIKAARNGLIPHWTWAMTFYGGLIGGIPTFLLAYKMIYLKNNEPILKEILRIAPCALTAGHAFGRMGCFLSGCCYGIATDSCIGIQFPGMESKVIPTQLIEMVFLIILSLILGILAFLHITDYTAVIYLISYAIFRLIIEFYRGDERGQMGVLSPSQFWCIVLFLGGILLAIFYSKYYFKKELKK